MKRLGKQRVEVLQLLNSLYKPNYKGWKNHPCREMWRGYEQALVVYGLAVCSEWKSRGYKDTCYEKINAFSKNGDLIIPPWIGREDIHLSHKSRLIQKYPEHYKSLWPDAPDNLEYVWPVELKGKL
jgi:hypothetical protein